MKAFGIDELKSHDVFEFCYANKFPHHWNDDSLYVEFDEFIALYPYFEKIVPNFKCYAPQKVSREQWRKIKSLLVDKEIYASFFEIVDHWLGNSQCNSDYFWIYGV